MPSNPDFDHIDVQSSPPTEPNQPRPGRKLRRRLPNPPPTVFQIVVTCRDESQQRELYEWLAGHVPKVRVLVL